MQIACLNQDPGIGVGDAKGAAVHVLALRRAFAELGAQVLCVDEKDPRRALEVLEDAHRAGPIDLVYERYAIGADAGASFARLHGVPLVLEVNAPLLEEARAFRGRAIEPADLEREREILDAATRVLAVSTPVARYAMRHGLGAERVLVRPNAVDATRFAPLAPEERVRVRASLGLDGGFVVGFHGRLRPWHGFERLAAAAGRLVADGLDVRVLALGAGDFERELSKHLPPRAYVVRPWVEHDAVPRIVACFDALPLCYAGEAGGTAGDSGAECYFSPLKLLEAMAVGAVPVAPPLGDLPETVIDGVNGLIVPAGDDRALRAALFRLATDFRLRVKLGAESVRAARTRSWTAIAREALGFAARQGAGLEGTRGR